MMIIHDEMDQGSLDWMTLRAGKITASESDAIISPLGKPREGEGVDTYLSKKLCERWTGGPLPALQGIFDLEQGQLLEDLAKPAFTLHTGIDARNVAFIETDDHCCGCSPDLLIGNESGVEIKAPRMDTHCGYLLAGKLPKAYAAQVQFSMWVTEFKTWHFFSFHRQLPPFHLVVERDEKFQHNITVAVFGFINRLDAAYARLVEINQGPPPPRPKLTPVREREQEQGEVTP